MNAKVGTTNTRIEMYTDRGIAMNFAFMDFPKVFFFELFDEFFQAVILSETKAFLTWMQIQFPSEGSPVVFFASFPYWSLYAPCTALFMMVHF
jgi:hypothetical protein